MATIAMPLINPQTPPLDTPNTNLPFPSLHLGSFDTKTPDDFASGPLPRPPRSSSSQGDKPPSWSLSSPSSSRTPVSPGRTAPLNLSRERLESNKSTRLAQAQSHSPQSSRLPIPPQLPPVNTGVKPSPAPGRAHPSLRSRADTGPSSSAGRPFTAPSLSSLPTQHINSTDIPPKQSLTVHIPSAPFPQYAAEAVYNVRQSPSVGRRRTIVQAAAMVSQPSEASFEESMPEGTPRADIGAKAGSIRQSSSPPRIERGSLMMPVACPTPASTAPTLRPSMDAPRDTQRPLEKKRSSADLKAISPNSPTPKRSLPRPPDMSNPSQATRQDSNGTSTTEPVAKPTPRLPTAPSAAIRPRARVQSQPSIPIVSGLADAGPYAAAKPSVKPVPQRTSKQPKEEICLECMMRDRDLADVDVVGNGVWERSSDVDFEEIKAREAALLDSLGPDNLGPMDHSGSGSVESDDESQPSSGHSMIDEARRRKRKDAKAARRKEVDAMVKDLGWRGFKWEERGSGLPEGFRGSKGMPLNESGIKAIMIKFPSSSAHRAENLDTYLYHQAILVRELRAEAKKKGGYAEPGTNLTPIISPRTSSVEWEAKHARELSAHMRGVFETTSKLDNVKLGRHRSPLDPNSTPLLEAPTVRPSPSSPADLSSLARMNVSRPADRPATHFIPEREPRARGMTTMSSMTTPNLRGPADDMDEFWPPTPESGLRPFSFAVRAGAGGGGSVSGSDGHGRRTMFGRFGGSVTSFFGGSNNGSGSMMDMHLGLDADKQENGYPRTTSLASPPRQSFFARSRTSFIAEQERRIRTSVSTSRLSQAIHPEDTKAKGFRGLLKKIKPKRDRDAILQVQTPQIYQEGALAPPPPMSYLDAATRQRSGSNSSLMTDNSSSLMGRQGFRSVSAPQAGSSSGGSQSASPTSSRYNRRESMNNSQTIGAEFLSPGPALGDLTIRGDRGTGTFRPHNKTSSSLSNSSLVTPPLGTVGPGTHNSFFAQPRTSPKSISSNRYTKTLPPVPRETSPDFGPVDYSRSPQQMYAQPNGTESVGSFGRREAYGHYGTRDPSKYGMRYSGDSYSIREEERSVKSKKGKGFRLFGTKGKH